MLERGALNLKDLQFIVLDEADEMLNMGFQEDVEAILGFAPKSDDKIIQTLLFSATMPAWVRNVAEKHLRSKRKEIDLVAQQKIQASVSVNHMAIPCHWTERNNILSDVIMVHAGRNARTIIFVNTKKEANEIMTASSMKEGCQVIHGDIPQGQRETTLKAYRDGKFSCLIATDVAARGIDIPDVELVVQLEPPTSVETYVHRSGRTGRANKTGTCITFFTHKQLWSLQQIEKVTKLKFKRQGIPSRDEIVRASAFGALESLMNVSDEAIPMFQDKAEAIIEKKGALWAVSAALAVISGNMCEIKERSLLTSSDKHVTVMVTGPMALRGLSPIWYVIRKCFYENPDDKVRGLRLTADSKGAVFDIPIEDKELIEQAKDYKFNIQLCKELPPLMEKEGERPPRPKWQQKKYGNNKR
jgi:ATP-dependent RNA helicase DDX21